MTTSGDAASDSKNNFNNGNGGSGSGSGAGGAIKMSPTPFRGVMTLEEEIELPAIPLNVEPFPPLSTAETSKNLSGNESSTLSSNFNTTDPVSASAAETSLTTTATPAVNDTIDSTADPIPTSTASFIPSNSKSTVLASPQPVVRSRKNNNGSKTANNKKTKRHRRRRTHSKDYQYVGDSSNKRDNDSGKSCFAKKYCCGNCNCDGTLVRSTMHCMNIVARLLFWSSAIASVCAVGWYSYELKKHGTDPHLIAWFSGGAFVILGFPISMYGIVMHLANYNQPSTQMYIVRILWMVPIYSIESWLCLRYKDYAIYIETLRDCYESYVLYSFLQYLIQVLGGEGALILMLKDKSPTRGVHMWGLQWCVKPWLMGQPLRRSYDIRTTERNHHTASALAVAPSSSMDVEGTATRPLHRVHWTSPFFVQCKFGVLQYVLLKFVCSFVVMILERNNLYLEGNFTPKGGYLYICILTNLSQCWALYCMIFFYYATKNELASIRPVGKFLSVKALVFFTWWQSVAISMLYQMDLIPHYQGGTGTGFSTFLLGGPSDDDTIVIDTAGGAPVPLSAEEALALDTYGGAALESDTSHHYSQPIISSTQQEWSAEDVAKGMQDYLICIEMFVAAIVHIFVFPHTEYDPKAVEARNRALNQQPHKDWNKRLGRKWREWDNKSGWSGTTTTSQEIYLNEGTNHTRLRTMSTGTYDEDDDLRIHPIDRLGKPQSPSSNTIKRRDDENDEEFRERKPLLALDTLDESEPENDLNHASFESLNSSDLNGSGSESEDEDDESSSGESVEYDEENPGFASAHEPISAAPKTGFVKALLDSAIPQDLRDNTVGIIKGDYVVEKKTLLHHAATSDSYDLFSRFKRPHQKSSAIKSKSSEEK